MPRVIKVTVLVVVALSAILCVFVLNIDWNAHRATLAAALEEGTGRKVLLGEDLHVEWGLQPILVARGFRIENTSWGSRPNMLTAAEIRAQIALLPLVGGHLEIVDLTCKGVDLLLEINDEGVGNWQFNDTVASDKDGAPDKRTPAQLQIHRLTLSDALVGLRPVDGETIHQAHIHWLKLNPRTAGTEWALAGEVEVNGVTMSIEATTAAPGTSPLRMDGTLDAKGINASAKGTIASAPDLSGLRLSTHLAVTEPGTLNRLSGGRLPLPALDLRAELESSPRGWQLSDIQLQYAGNQFKGELAIEHDASSTRLSGAFGVAHLVLDSIVGGDKVFDTPAKPIGASSWQASLPSFPRLEERLDISLYADEISFRNFAIKDFKTHLRNYGEGIEFGALQAQVFGAPANGQLGIEPQGESLSVNLQLKSDGFDLQAAQQAFGAKQTLSGKGHLKLDLHTTGASPAGLAAKLDGTATLKLVDAKARFGGLDSMVGGLAGLFSAKGSDAKWSVLNCGALSLDFDDGVGDTQLLLDTNQAIITGTGDIDLGKTTLNLSLRPKPKSITLNLAVPIDITGPLAEPQLTPQTAASMRRLGGLIGSTIFPPAALLAFADTGGGTDACLSHAAMSASAGATNNPSSSLAETTGRAVQTSGEAISKGATAAGKAVEGAVESIGGALKNLFGN